MRQFGVEIEMVGVTRWVVAFAVQSVVGGRKPRRVVNQQDRTLVHIEVKAADGAIWKVEDDDSLQAPKRHRAELVSPILMETEIPLLRSVAARVAATGALPNSSCGIHVHIDARQAQVEDINRLMDVMIREERKLLRDFGCSPSRISKFAKLIADRFVEEFTRRRPRTAHQLARLWYGKRPKPEWFKDRYHESRYRGLNLQSYFFHGTVEFRYFDSSLDPDRIEAYVRRCIEIADKAKMP